MLYWWGILLPSLECQVKTGVILNFHLAFVEYCHLQHICFILCKLLFIVYCLCACCIKCFTSRDLVIQWITSATSSGVTKYLGARILHAWRPFIHKRYPDDFISGRELAFTFAICYRRSVCLSSVCDVGAPYSGGWTFRQFFFTIR